MSPHIIGLPPLIASGAKVLILGSIPGGRSLERRQYYVGRGNRFWQVMARLLGGDHERPYEKRLDHLLTSGVALWDVIHSCDRAGSLDASIVPGSEVPNGFDELLHAHPTLRLIAFNGRKASQTFEEHIGSAVLDGRPVTTLSLPSTSGANARYSIPKLVERWLPVADASASRVLARLPKNQLVRPQP